MARTSKSNLRKRTLKWIKLLSDRPINSVQWNEKLPIAIPEAPKVYIRNYKSSI